MKAGNWILFLCSLQSVLLGHLYVGAALLFRFAEKPAYEPGLVLTAQWRPWMDRKWKYSTTIGRGIIYKPDRRDEPDKINTTLERHERKHIWQQEDMCFLATLIGGSVAATGEWIIGLIVWASAILWLAVNFITAGLRFHDFSYEALYRNANVPRTRKQICRVSSARVGKSFAENQPFDTARSGSGI
jgi:hypothetical protein